MQQTLNLMRCKPPSTCVHMECCPRMENFEYACLCKLQCNTFLEKVVFPIEILYQHLTHSHHLLHLVTFFPCCPTQLVLHYYFRLDARPRQ